MRVAEGFGFFEELLSTEAQLFGFGLESFGFLDIVLGLVGVVA